MKKTATILLYLILASLSISAQENDAILKNYMRNMQYSQALEHIDRQDVTPLLQYQKAICYKALDNYGDAINILQTLEKDDPTNVRVNTELASCFIAISDWLKSAQYYKTLTELDTANVFFQTQYANMLLKIGNYPKALPLYNSIYEKYALKSVYRNKAECYENLNMNDSAIVYYQKAWDNNKFDTYSLASTINLQLKQNNIHRAVTLSDEYVEQDSTNRVINKLNAMAYYATNLLYDDATRRFERCVQQGDSSSAVIKGLAMCYYTLGENEKAYPYLTKSYLADTANVNILFPLAEVCNDLDRSQEAIIYYNKILDKIIMPRAVFYANYKGLATAYEKAEQYNDALINYIQTLEHTSSAQDRMNLLYTMGIMCDEKKKDEKNAIYYYGEYRMVMSMYLRRLEFEQKNGISKDNLSEKIEVTAAKISRLDERINELKLVYNQKIEDELDIDSIYTDEAKKHMVKLAQEKAAQDSMRLTTQKDSIVVISKR